MNDISKFNNQYLKCIVTKYKSTIDGNSYLANSGSLIIYHPDNETGKYMVKNIDGTESEKTYSRNYIYLGDEFLASGYGFLYKEMRDKAEYIVKTYDDTIARLDEADAKETKNRKKEDQKLWDELNKYVKINGGPIDDTIVTIGGKNIRTKDVLLYGEEAKYRNLEITNINLRINGEEVKDDIVYLPLGAKLKIIEINIEYNVNDSGGIEKLEVYHKNLDYVNSNNYNGDAENVEAVVIEYDQDDNGNSTEGTISYKKIFDSSSQLYVTDIIEGIISGFNIYVRKTPIDKYKLYPRLKEACDVEITSTGNMIMNNIIQLFKNITIIPMYTMHYMFCENETDTLTYKNIVQHPNKILYNPVYNEVSIGVHEATGESYNPKVLYIAVPSIYKVNKLYAVNENEEIDGDNLIGWPGEYNWTGSVLIKSSYVELVSYYNEEEQYDKFYTVPYRIYKIKDTNSFIFEKVKIEISLININKYYDDNKKQLKFRDENNERIFNEIHEVESIASGTISFTSSDTININDEEFNALYWVNFLQNENKNGIHNILNPIVYNSTLDSIKQP